VYALAVETSGVFGAGLVKSKRRITHTAEADLLINACGGV